MRAYHRLSVSFVLQTHVHGSCLPFSGRLARSRSVAVGVRRTTALCAVGSRGASVITQSRWYGKHTSSAGGPAPPDHIAHKSTHIQAQTSTASPSSTDAHGEPPIHPDLVVGLREILSRLLSDNQWLSIADIYGDLPPNARRTHVRPHKALVHVLRRLEKPLAIVVSPSGLYCGRGAALPPDPAASASAHANPVATTRTSATPTPAPVAPPARASTSSPPAPASSAAAGAVSGPVIPAAVDFYYDVELPLDRVPPPPPDFDVTPSSLPSPSATEDGSVMALSTFISYIPSFFVPLQEVLAQMPGYTEEHIHRYLHLKATEMVSVCGQSYIRVHGGYRRVSLEGNTHAEAHFESYRPRLEWLAPFEAAFGESVGEWIPLPVLLARVPLALLETLPWGAREVPAVQRTEIIFFFAQMQHRFAFSFDAQGRGSVLRRPPGYGGLDVATSPTPRAVNVMLGIVPIDGIVDVAQVRARLPASVLAEMEAYYGGLDGFLAAHKPVFYRPDDGAGVVVMRTRYHERLYKASLPLEKQLELAVAARQKQKVRTLRRQIAFRSDPAHPFHDPDNLAQEISKFLPRRGFIQLKVFLKSHVPEELHGFLPRKLHNFFSNYPQYFQQFEYQKAGTWCLSRPDQPLPRGVIRPTFSGDDLIVMCAEYLQERPNGCACTTLFLHLPRAAQETVRKHHGGMFYFLQKYPRYFRLVLDSDGGNAASSAMVHVVEVPTKAQAAHATMTAAHVTGSSSSDAHANDVAVDVQNESDEEDEDEDTEGESARADGGPLN